VQTDDDFVARTVALANDPVRLTEMRQTLRPALKASSLCDAAGFIEDFQNTMMEVVRKHGLRS
jgi:predicted O-linked N-acetylglucosamine transferase (SPINDLY family)